MTSQRFPKLNSLLNTYIRRYRGNCLLAGLGFVAIVLLLPLPVGCVLDRFILLPDAIRIGLWAAYVSCACFVTLKWMVFPLVQRHTPLQAAFSLDDRCPDLKETFSVAVQLDAAAKLQTHGCSRILVYSAQRQAEEHAAGQDVRKLLPRRRAWMLCGLGAIAAAVQVPLFLAASLQYPQLLARFLNPFGNYARVSGVEVAVQPGSADLGDGERLTVEARVSDPDLARLGLNLEFEDGEPQRFEMARSESGRFVFVVANARKDFSYHLSEGLVRTESYRVRVQRRPKLERFHIRYEYPGYTGWPGKTEEKQDGNLAALAGTRVTLRVELDTGVDQVLLRRREADGNRDLPMTLDGGRQASIAWDLVESFDYQIIAIAEDGGVNNASPVLYTAQAVADLPPQVSLLEPSRSTKLDPRATQAIRFEARDEFSITAARLLIRRAGGIEERRPIEAQGLGETLIQGSGWLSLAELKAEPGEAIDLAVEARDLTGQWGSSAQRSIEVPVAAGDLAAVRQADDVAPVRLALAELSGQLGQTHATLAELAKLLNPPPDKWSRTLESNVTPLRSSFEALRNQAGLLTGIAMRQREQAVDAQTRRELAPMATLASGLEQAVKRFNLEQFLIEVRQGFQQDGPAQARAAGQDASSWSASVNIAALALAAFERQLRIRDLSLRARELLEAQQSLLIVDEHDAVARARAADLQRLVLEETHELLDGIATAANMEPVSKDLAGVGGAQAVEVVASLSKQRAAGSELPIESLSDSVSLLSGVYKDLQVHERAFEQLFAKLSRESQELRSRQLSAATLLHRLSENLTVSLRDLAKDPLDKVDELERLTPLVARLRRTLQMLQDCAGELWGRAEGTASGPGAALRRRDFTALAYRLHELDRHAGSAVRELCVRIAATFETDEVATPVLPDLRRELAALHQGIVALEATAGICDELMRLQGWASQMEEDLRVQRAQRGMAPRPGRRPGKSAGMSAALPAFNSPVPALEAVVAAAREASPAGMVAVWHRVARALVDGIPALQSARSEFLLSPVKRRAELQRQAVAWRSLAAGLEPGSADVQLSIARCRAAVGNLRALMGLLATEPGCLVAAGQLPAARTERLRFLALWAIHQESAFPVIMVLDACVAEGDADARGVLLGRARALAAETASRLEEAGEAASSDGGDWLAAFTTECALGPDADQALHHAEQVLAAARHARKTGQVLLGGEAGRTSVAAQLQELGTMLRPYARKSHEAARKELEVLAQETSRQAGELADAGRKVVQIGHSAEGLLAVYEELASGLPESRKRLAADLQAAQAAAQRYGTNITAALGEMADRLRRAHEPVARFASERVPAAGQAVNKALQVQTSAEDFERLLDERIALQRAQTVDNKVLSGQLLDQLRAGFAKLNEIKQRYDAGEAERNAAFDAMHAEARIAYKLLWNMEYLECYMKWTPPSGSRANHPDSEKTPKQRVEEYLASKGMGGWQSYNSKLHFIGLAGFQFMGKEKVPRNWKPPIGSYRRGTAVGNYYESTAGDVKKLVDTVDKWLQLASERSPEDIEVLNRWKTDYQKAHDVLLAGLERWRPQLVPETWKEVRRSFAVEIEALEKSFQPAVDLLVARAEAKGWKKPEIEVNRRGKIPTSVIPQPPKAEASIESAAHYAYLLGQDLRRVHLYTLLGGENDPDADLQRALQAQDQPVPDDVLGSAAKLAAALQDIMAQVQEQLDSGPELKRELDILLSERTQLSELAQRYHGVLGKEQALRAALLAATEGKKALSGRFVRAAGSLPRDIAGLQNRLDQLIQTAPSLSSAESLLHEALALFAAESWEREAEQLGAALGADQRAQVATLTAAQAAKLDQAASLLRRSLQLSAGSGAAPESASAVGVRLASASTRLIAGDGWRVLAELIQEEPDEAVAAACLLLAQDLDQAAVLELDALGRAFIESAGQAEWKALQSLISSVSQTIAVAGLGSEAGPQVLGRLQLRPLGQDPSGQHYGRLPPLLVQDLQASSREQRPRELESAWKRYLHGILNPPLAEAAKPSPGVQP